MKVNKANNYITLKSVISYFDQLSFSELNGDMITLAYSFAKMQFVEELVLID